MNLSAPPISIISIRSSAVLQSWIIALSMVAIAFFLKLLPSIMFGFVVFALTSAVAEKIVGRACKERTLATKIAVAAVSSITLAALVVASAGLWKYMTSGGPQTFLEKSVQLIDAGADLLPPEIAGVIPGWATNQGKVRLFITNALKENAGTIAAIGQAGLMAFAKIVLGGLIGAMAAWRLSTSPYHPKRPLLAEAAERAKGFAETIYNYLVVQTKISAINATMALVFLKVILPLFGWDVPNSTALAGATFVFGLIPVVGNIISNVVITLGCLSVSTYAALAGLGFLVFLHKAEWLLLAKIGGGTLKIPAWELIAIMFAMESVAGIAGVLFAPVGWAWVRSAISLWNESEPDR